MIDIHAHIIFGVDDGPTVLDESLALLEDSYQQGVRSIIATSHRRKDFFEAPEEVIEKNFQIIQSEIAKIHPDMALYYGAEIYHTLDIYHKLEENNIPTLAQSDFVLLEFAPNTRFTEMEQAVARLVISGKNPVLAHVERYEVLAFDQYRMESLIKRGAYLQINAASVLKPKLWGDVQKKYKLRAKFILDHDLAHFVASDVHDCGYRRNYLSKAYAYVSKCYGQDKANELFYENPLNVLENRKM